ncbi:ribonuclease H-like domain-containing protein [Tanacetum coccineum]
MKAAVISTISDFPGYANLSGWSTKGEYACPVCAFDKTSKWLNHGRKWCYMGHRRWIEPNHSSRKDTRSFDGHQELRQPPILASGDDILDQLKGVDFLSENVEKSPWKKKSIFFMFGYVNFDKKTVQKRIHKKVDVIKKLRFQSAYYISQQKSCLRPSTVIP